MEIKNILKNTGFLISSKIFSFIIGIIRAKLNAVYLGTIGVGITSQLQDSLNKIATASTFGMESGLIKIISAHKEDANKLKLIQALKTYIILILPLAVSFFIIGIFFLDELTILFLGNINYKNYFIITFIFFPLIIYRSIPSSLLYAFKKIKIIVIAEILSSILIFLSYIFLILNLNLLGAVINISLSVMISVMILTLFAFKKVVRENDLKISHFFTVSFSKEFAKELITIGGIGLVLSYYEIFCETFARAFVVNKIGIESLGLYNPILAWAGLFTGFIYPSIFGYLGPRFSESKSDEEVVNITNDAFRVLTFATIPVIFLAISFRNLIIPLFYSNQFIGAAEFLPLHFIGILFGTWVYIFTIIFMPTGRIKKYIPFGLGHNTLSLLIILILTPLIGLWALAIRYILTPFILSIALYYFYYRTIKFRFYRDNIFLIIYSIGGVIIIYVFTFNNYYNYLLSVLLTFSTYFLLRTQEKKFLIAKLKFKK